MKMYRRMALLMTGAMLFSGCAANAEATANGGWICTGTDAEMQVYVFGAGASVYCAQAFYPAEAAEGWGTRMYDIIATMKLI